jgi:hypothetical protein
MRPHCVLVALALAGLPLAANAQLGGKLPDVPLTGFTATAATSLADYEGRLLLLEFFAYW